MAAINVSEKKVNKGIGKVLKLFTAIFTVLARVAAQ
jgi:hypothetical protein